MAVPAAARDASRGKKLGLAVATKNTSTYPAMPPTPPPPPMSPPPPPPQAAQQPFPPYTPPPSASGSPRPAPTQHFSLSPTRVRSHSTKSTRATYSLFPPTPQDAVPPPVTFEPPPRPRQDSSTLPFLPTSDPARPGSSPQASAPPPVPTGLGLGLVPLQADSTRSVQAQAVPPVPSRNPMRTQPPPLPPPPQTALPLRPGATPAPTPSVTTAASSEHSTSPPASIAPTLAEREPVRVGFFGRFQVRKATTMIIQPSSTTSVVGQKKAHVFLGNHTVFVDDEPIFQWTQGLFSRRTIRESALRFSSRVGKQD